LVIVWNSIFATFFGLYQCYLTFCKEKETPFLTDLFVVARQNFPRFNVSWKINKEKSSLASSMICDFLSCERLAFYLSLDSFV